MTDAVTVPESSGKFGSAQGPIALSRVRCTGNESILLNCQLVSIAAASRHYCTHGNDVGISCPGMPTSAFKKMDLLPSPNNFIGVVFITITSVLTFLF